MPSDAAGYGWCRPCRPKVRFSWPPAQAPVLGRLDATPRHALVARFDAATTARSRSARAQILNGARQVVALEDLWVAGQQRPLVVENALRVRGDDVIVLAHVGGVPVKELIPTAAGAGSACGRHAPRVPFWLRRRRGPGA